MTHLFTHPLHHAYALRLEFSAPIGDPSWICGYSTGRSDGHGDMNTVYCAEVGFDANDPLSESYPGNEDALIASDDSEDDSPWTWAHRSGESWVGPNDKAMLIFLAYRPRPEQVALIVSRVRAATERSPEKLLRASLMIATTGVAEEPLDL